MRPQSSIFQFFNISIFKLFPHFRTTLLLVFLLFPPVAGSGLGVGMQQAAAQEAQLIPLRADELVQYQRAKDTGRSVGDLFRRYGMKRTRASNYLSDTDTRRIWHHRVQADSAYQASMPLYRLFRPATEASLAVIDDQGGSHTTQYVFWNKAYYHRLSRALRRMGFTMTQSTTETNVLEMRNPDVPVAVDFIIWPDRYVMQTYARPTGE